MKKYVYILRNIKVCKCAFINVEDILFMLFNKIPIRNKNIK